MTHTLQTWPFSQFALKLYLELIASSISSPVIPSHHFIPGKRVLYLSIHFFLPYNNLRGALRVVRCDLVFFFPSRCLIPLSKATSSNCAAASMIRSSALIPECSKSFIQGLRCDHTKLAFRMPDSERKLHIGKSLLFAFLSLGLCVCVAAGACDPHSMFSLVLSSTQVGVALLTASLTTVSIATVCSLLIICTKGKCPNVAQALIEADSLTLLCWFKDCVLKGHFLFVRGLVGCCFLFPFS